MHTPAKTPGELTVLVAFHSLPHCAQNDHLLSITGNITFNPYTTSRVVTTSLPYSFTGCLFPPHDAVCRLPRGNLHPATHQHLFPYHFPTCRLPVASQPSSALSLSHTVDTTNDRPSASDFPEEGSGMSKVSSVFERRMSLQLIVFKVNPCFPTPAPLLHSSSKACMDSSTFLIRQVSNQNDGFPYSNM